jgi:hypothetical protein
MLGTSVPMRRTAFVLGVTALTGALTVSARADLYCPDQISIFGTILDVRGDIMTVHTTSNIGDIHVQMHSPQLDAHGMQIRPGVFAGVYGCLQPGGRVFSADEVTLATNADGYAAYQLPLRSYDGTVTSVAANRIEIQTGAGGKLWVTTSQGGLRAGSHLHVSGRFDPHNGQFAASGVSVTH